MWCIYFSSLAIILIHDNIRPHDTKMTLQKFTDMWCEILLHPPYSLDLSITYYHFFKNLKTFLRQKPFRSKGERETAFKDFLVSKALECYHKGIYHQVNGNALMFKYFDWLKHSLNSLIQI